MSSRRDFRRFWSTFLGANAATSAESGQLPPIGSHSPFKPSAAVPRARTPAQVVPSCGPKGMALTVFVSRFDGLCQIDNPWPVSGVGYPRVSFMVTMKIKHLTGISP